MNEQTNSKESIGSGMVARPGVREDSRAIGVYHIECHAPDGSKRWEVDIDNLVVTAGRNKLLDAALKTGLTTPAWYVGLITGPGGSNTYAAADTMGSHAGWAENTSYSEANRQTLTLGAIASGSVANTASPAVFTLNGAATIGGAFLSDSSTKGGTTGTLYSAGSNSNGDKSGSSADTITVTYTATIT
jgi:hypothetical protein